MGIDTTFFHRCIAVLEHASLQIKEFAVDNDIRYDIYRAACVKEFELVLGQSGKLLRKRLEDYFASNNHVDKLNFKDLFRHAARHCLLDTDAVERWLGYRDCRNSSAYEYGEDFAEDILNLVLSFINDAKALAHMIEQRVDD